MSKSRIFILLALLSAFPPLATDMYLPAIPHLQKIWNQPLTVINMTLVMFFISYCFSLLIYGPLSDRFGRRKPLLVGITIFIISSVLCALANNVTTLIVARILQAAGAASAAALALAITKDIYTATERARILAWMGVTMALAPAVSPMIGSWIMIWCSWRWIFIAQATIAIISWVGVLMMQETLKEPSSLSATDTAKIYITLLKNKRYLCYALIVSLVALPHFSFIAGSADIYITKLGLTEQRFGFFYAVNAAAYMSGSLLCTRLLKRYGLIQVMTLGCAGIAMGGFLMLMRFSIGPWSLALPMALVTFSLGIGRPPSNNLVLEQVYQYAGAASSLLVFLFFLVGAFAMWIISLNWPDKIVTIGIIASTIGTTTLIFWLMIESRFSKQRGS